MANDCIGGAIHQQNSALAIQQDDSYRPSVQHGHGTVSVTCPSITKLLVQLNSPADMGRQKLQHGQLRRWKTRVDPAIGPR